MPKPKIRTMTHEERQELIRKPFRPIPRVVSTGAIWAGVQVTDTFFGEAAGPPMQRMQKNVEYDGIYKDAVNITAADAVALFADGGE